MTWAHCILRHHLKRVIITSSVKAILGLEPRTYTEDDWSEFATKEVEEKGKVADKMSMYCASKLLAERGKQQMRTTFWTWSLPVLALSGVEIRPGPQALVGPHGAQRWVGLRGKHLALHTRSAG